MTDLTIGDQIKGALDEYVRHQPRSRQSSEGRLGVSDVGGCRQYAVLRTRQTPESDERGYLASAFGTAIHTAIEDACKEKWGDDVITGHEVLTKYPNGAVLPGHPDLVFPIGNVVVDIKTVDGIHTVEKSGPSTHQWWQVNGYAAGLLGDGTLDPERPVTIALVFVDRSARSDRFITFTAEFSEAMLNESSFWVDDVIYAVNHGEDSQKDKPYDFCRGYCEFFSICREGDGQPEGLVTDPEVISAADQYLEAMEMEKTAKALKDEAKARMLGYEGSTGNATIRWTEIGPCEIPGTFRNAYTRLDVRPIKGGK